MSIWWLFTEARSWPLNEQSAGCDGITLNCRCCPRAADHALGDEDQGSGAVGAERQVHHEADGERMRAVGHVTNVVG